MSLNTAFFSHPLTVESLTKGVKLELDTIRLYLKHLKDPQTRYKTIHLAGTNGKGSTSNLLYRLLHAHGIKAGVFNSPHILDIEERFSAMGRHPCGEETVSILDTIHEIREKMIQSGVHGSLTFFELTTVFALMWFATLKLDISVIETGLGGRLDASNVIASDHVVITSIGKDHEHYLGSDLLNIAREKAGIVYPHSNLVLGYMDDAVGLFFKDNVKTKQTFAFGNEFNVVRVGANFHYQSRGILNDLAWSTEQLPEYQKYNTGMALKTCENLEELRYVWERSLIQKTLAEFHLKGRFSVIRRHPLLVLDVAHNPQGISALKAAIQNKFGDVAWHVICGFSKDKDAGEMLNVLKTFSQLISFVPFQHERSMDPYTYSQLDTNIMKFHTLTEAFSYFDSTHAPILVCGSFFLIDEAYRLLKHRGLLENDIL